jgi:hypothetical protein
MLLEGSYVYSSTVDITDSTITLIGVLDSAGVPISKFRNQVTSGELLDLRNSTLIVEDLNITSIRDCIGFVDTADINVAILKHCLFYFDGIGCLVTLRVGGYVVFEGLNKSNFED